MDVTYLHMNGEITLSITIITERVQKILLPIE